MGIRREEDGTYTVWYAKRHPITRRPYNMRRTKIKTKAEAHGVYDQLVIKLHEKFQNNISPLWADVANEFFEDYLNRGIKKSTVSNYKQSIKAHTFKKWKGREISSINTDEIGKLITEDLADRTDPTKKSILKYIRSVFNYALEKNIIGRNPVPKMQFKRNEKIKKVLNETELRIFLQKAKAYNHEWFPIWAVACYTGLRNGELFALRWENVSLESRIMVIKESWSKLDGFKETKSSELFALTWDDVDLENGIIRITKSYSQRIKGIKSTKNSDWRNAHISEDLKEVLLKLRKLHPNAERVLPRPGGWNDGNAAKILRAFLVRIGIDKYVTFHTLRACFATHVLASGTEPTQVMKMGGWADFKTFEIYVRMAGVDVKGVTDDFKVTPKFGSLDNVIRLKK